MCVVANTVLRPFSLGHHLLLKRLGLPFAGNPLADAGEGDLAMGIAVCAGRYETTLDSLLSGGWPQVVKRWRQRASGPWWNRAHIDWVECEILFRSYIYFGYQHPPVFRWPDSSCSVSMSAPWEELLLVKLVAAGFTASEVLNGYLPAMWYHYYTAMEIHRAAECRDFTKWRQIFISKDFADA